MDKNLSSVVSSRTKRSLEMKYGFELEEEVERLHELEVIPRIKCMQCHAYMPSGTKSFFCLKCPKKRIATF